MILRKEEVADLVTAESEVGLVENFYTDLYLSNKQKPIDVKTGQEAQEAIGWVSYDFALDARIQDSNRIFRFLSRPI